ncbi:MULTISPECIES: hypothetical protein [Devosia]|uniref:hypothetical protein n=1 Tax=Devosia TaxID=46913 RepID=UPI001300402F|nr:MULTISPECIES: hypothetical protein [Devosia]
MRRHTLLAIPFPYPDIPNPMPPFPAAPPMEATAAELAGWWLEVGCSCGAGGRKLLPFRMLAAQRGWDTTLRSIVSRLRCNDCGARPKVLAVVESASGGPGRHNASDPKRLVIR